jgi:phage gp46-like protein
MGTADPIRIQGWADIRELALMSIGTDKGAWWADPGFGSELWLLRQTGKVDDRTAGTVRRMLDECLAWLKEDGLAGGIACTAERGGKNGITYAVTILRPDGDPVIIKDTWYGL